MIQIQSVYTKKVEAYGVLYAMLMQRLDEENTNISHKKMPTWDEHCKFVDSKPHKDWFLVFNKNEELIGQFYITKKKEIGIYVIKRYRRVDYGNQIMHLILKREKGSELFANINPENEASIAFFKKHGFVHIQNTYSCLANSAILDSK